VAEGSITVSVWVGFLLLLFAYLMVSAVGMPLSATILGQFIQQGVLVAVILFQREIRRFLFLLGDAAVVYGRGWTRRLLGRRTTRVVASVTAIIEAAKALAGSNTGALIVVANANTDDLKFYKESGDLIDAVVSKRLLLAVFNKQSPLHDGGVIIYDNKVLAARSILPITESQDVPAQLGLRHRAAIGMTEATTTLVLVVSEETGQISIARGGKLENNLAIQEARAMLNDYLQDRRQA
jgi:diadenylate cyclase